MIDEYEDEYSSSNFGTIISNFIADVQRNISPTEKLKEISRFIKREFNIKTYLVYKNMLISGFYDSDEKAIFLNKNHNSQRQVFSLVHELGHFVFGHQSSWRREGFDYNKTKEDEFLANKFAGEFLMPETEFISQINEFRRNTKIEGKFTKEQKQILFERLANYFSVSKSYVEIRYYTIKDKLQKIAS